LEAAEQVCAGDGIESGEVLDLLTRLVDKSLVMKEEQAGAARYTSRGHKLRFFKGLKTQGQ
jgi:non-specific serine/threonine protein kinase